jgi:monovalent cation:H+ antiporter-2, CPA2 family
MHSSFEFLLLLLIASALAVALVRRFNLPALLGYLLVGVALAPFADRWGSSGESLESIGTFGVVFLMFSVGLEFNIDKLRNMRRYVLRLGAPQVAGSMVVGAALLLLPAALVSWLFLAPVDWRGGIVLGAALAMSSTAIVAKLLAERRELDSEHGQRVMAILLFQDLAVIPILVLLPSMAGQEQNWLSVLVLAMLKAAIILGLLFKFGRAGLRRWFAAVARRKSNELFTLNVLLVTLLAAWMTSKAGLSLELGAFVAGMLISETEYRHQVEDDIKSFRDLLLGVFFIALGSRLDLSVVFVHWLAVLVLLALPVLFKFGLVYFLVLKQGASTLVSARTALYLAQAGEFGLVILTQAADRQLLTSATVQVVLAAMLLSLVISPLILAQSDRLLLRLSNQAWLDRSLQLQAVARRTLKISGHVIVCGFGRSGQSVAHALESEKVAYVALDLDPDRVSVAAAAGESVVYGDAARRETLLAAGLHRASAVVISIHNIDDALRVLRLIRQLAPQIPVLARSIESADIHPLRQAGATEVVPEVAEGSLLLASHAMVLAGVPLQRMQQRVNTIRSSRYLLLNGYFHSADERSADIEQDDIHLQTVNLSSSSKAVGQTVGNILLHNVKLTAVLRGGQRLVEPPVQMQLQVDDVLVLSGSLQALADTADQLG